MPCRHYQRPPALFLSLADCCDEIGVSRRHLERLVARGTIPSVRLGRRRLVLREGLYEYLWGLMGAYARLYGVRAPGRPRRRRAARQP